MVFVSEQCRLVCLFKRQMPTAEYVLYADMTPKATHASAQGKPKRTALPVTKCDQRLSIGLIIRCSQRQTGTTANEVRALIESGEARIAKPKPA